MKTDFHKFPIELGRSYSMDRRCRLRGKDSVCEEVDGREQDCAQACESENT